MTGWLVVVHVTVENSTSGGWPDGEGRPGRGWNFYTLRCCSVSDRFLTGSLISHSKVSSAVGSAWGRPLRRRVGPPSVLLRLCSLGERRHNKSKGCKSTGGGQGMDGWKTTR